MPYKEILVKAKRVLTRKGVSVYLAFEDNNESSGALTYTFALEPYGEADTEFDVRDLPGAEALMCPAPSSRSDKYLNASKSQQELYDKQWKQWTETGRQKAILDLIRQNIDSGVIKPYVESIA